MKKIIVVTVIGVMLTNFCLAQENETVEENKNTVPPSRIGGTVGFQILQDHHFLRRLDNSIGVNLFFHQTISSRWFFSLDIGYHYYTGVRYEYNIGLLQNLWKEEHTSSFIPVTVGMNFFLTKTGVRPYFGIELGLLNTINQETTEFFILVQDTFVSTWNETLILFVPTIGISAPITKNICLVTNIKFQRDMESLINTGINLGVSYSIP
jgi:outer membrane protein W